MITIHKVMRGLTPMTTRSITQFIGSTEAEYGFGWFIGKELEKINDGETGSKSLQKKLQNIQQEFDDINLITSIKNTQGRDWEHLQNRLLQAEMDVGHKFQLLQTILANNESNHQRDVEIKRLQHGILDSNNGVLSNLSVIHQELVGKTVDSTKKGLLEIWCKGVCNSMHETPISAKTCYDILMKHLKKAAILQLQGFLLYKGANENSQFCVAQFHNLEKNLKLQKDVMDNHISDTMKYLANPSKENEFYLRTVSGVPFEPFVKGQGENKALFRAYHLQNNAFEKWTFEESLTFDIDGSLFISGNSKEKDGTRSYIGVNDKNRPTIVSKEKDVQSFFVMPIDEENSKKIIICKSTPESQQFLGNNLKFTEKKDNIEFTITKKEDMFETERKWDVMFNLVSWWSKIKTKFE